MSLKYISYSVDNTRMTPQLMMSLYCNLSHINIQYYLKLRIPIMHRHFFRKLSRNRDYIETFCNGRRNPLRFACRQNYLYNNPQ